MLALRDNRRINIVITRYEHMMVNPFTMIIRPIRFFEALEEHPDVRTGLAVFTFAALSQVVAAVSFFNFKTVYEVVLEEYSVVELRLFGLDYLIMSGMTTVFIALVVLVGVGRILGRFLGGKTPSMRVFITAALHIFLVFAVVNAGFTALAAAAPSEKYYVFGVEFNDIIFRNATLTWVDENGAKNTTVSELVYARKANVTRVFPNMSTVKSGAYTPSQLAEIISKTRLRAYLSQVSAPPFNLSSTIMVEEISFSEISARNVVLTSVAVVKGGLGDVLIQLALARNILWRILLSVYLGLCVKTLHSTSKKASLLIMIVSYLAVSNLVPTIP